MARLLPFLVLLTVSLAYSNHFQNGFHFDDAHTVVNNPSIRSLSNIPTFFRDGSTFSILPANQGYRPLVSTTLAVDYALGGGLHPPAFHASTFALFLLQLLLMAWLFEHLLRDIFSPTRARLVAWLATWIYGLHPVGAETVNYVIQRADLHVALGLVAGVGLYARKPSWRRWGIPLLPFVLAALSKPTALVFPLLIFLYARLYEPSARPWLKSFLAALPAVTVAIILAWLHHVMTPAAYTFGGASPTAYRLTQPYVAWTYLKAFFWPTELSADTDMAAVTGLADPRLLAGVLFLAALSTAIVLCARRSRGRPVAFGLGWFVITQLPTALAPLAEVTNDHRMFGPFVGLSLAVVSALAVWLEDRLPRRAGLVLIVLVLALAGWGTHERNKVWHNDESLWRDVVEKSPGNGRGWMNYGLSQMSRGRYVEALEAFEKAQPLAPNYSVLEINLGLVKGAMDRPEEAEKHFRRALKLKADSTAHYFFGRWLAEQRRPADAEYHLHQAVTLNPADRRAERRLAELLLEQRQWHKLKSLAQASEAPEQDWEALLERAARGEAEEEERLRRQHQTNPTGPSWLAQSYFLYRAGRFEESLQAALQATALDPGMASAHNNVAAAYLALRRYEEAAAAARRALERDPDLDIAKNNLAAAERGRR